MLNERTIELIDKSNGTGPGEVRVAGSLDAGTAVGIVRMGFGSDPVARWMYPDPADYLNIFPEFIRVFAGKAIEAGTAYISPGKKGAALWLPPGVGPDEGEIDSVFKTTISPLIQRDLFTIFDQMGEFHPEEPHWYLPMIAVDPFRQGNGIGSSLMKFALERCDEQNRPAYLESSNPKNITLYQRFGFEILGIIQSGGSPPLFPMLRPPQKAGSTNEQGHI